MVDRVSWASDYSAEFGQRKDLLGKEKDKAVGSKGTDGRAEAGGCRL